MIRASLLSLLFVLPAFAESTHDGYHDGEPEQGGAEERGDVVPVATEPPMAPPDEEEQGGAEERGDAPDAQPEPEPAPEPAAEPEQGGAEERGHGTPAAEDPAPADDADGGAQDAAPAPGHEEAAHGGAAAGPHAALALPVEGPELEEGGHEERGEHVPLVADAGPAADAGRVGGTMALLLLLIGGGFGVAHAVRQQLDA